jgi:hypothetical protein
MFKTVLLTFMLFILISCGETESQHEPREEKTLYLKAPIIDGIDYTCGERTGISKPYTKDGATTHGVVTCIYSPMYLNIGSLKLGMVTDFVDGQQIYPQDLIPSFDGDFNNEKLLKLAIFMQSLNSNGDYITITEEIKSKITITSLDELTLEELKQEIIHLGMVPVSKEEAKVYLLLNSENTRTGKPIIKPFEEAIGTAMTMGSTIGKLSIEEGDAPLIAPLTLEGIGKENFIINQNGSIKLAKNLNNPATYNLTVTAVNPFGYTKVPITLMVKEGNRIGKAQLGRLSNATVTISRLNPDKTQQLLYTTTTQSTGSLNLIGNFNLREDMLDDNAFYIYEISGGVDIDRDDNGKRDENITNNRGELRLITKGIWIKNSTHKIRITPLSEMLYSYIEQSDYNQLEEHLNQYAQILLKESIDCQSGVDVRDIMIFDPLNDQEKLYATLQYDNTYNSIVDKIRKGDRDYKEQLLSAFTVDSFSANAIEIVGSYIYTVDMMESGEFRIYDLETKELVGSLKLPNTPVEEDTHLLYINLLTNTAIVGSLTDWTYVINIENQKEPSLDEEPFIRYLVLSGNFSRTAIGKSLDANLLAKDRKYYLYSNLGDSGKSQKISIFKIDESDEEYLTEFDSKLSKIDSLWIHNNHIYIVGDNKMVTFFAQENKIVFKNSYDGIQLHGNIIGIEEDILYLLSNKKLTLIDISSVDNPKFLETISVHFEYKLGIKTNGRYITTDSKIIDIPALRASKKSN